MLRTTNKQTIKQTKWLKKEMPSEQMYLGNEVTETSHNFCETSFITSLVVAACFWVIIDSPARSQSRAQSPRIAWLAVGRLGDLWDNENFYSTNRGINSNRLLPFTAVTCTAESYLVAIR